MIIIVDDRDLVKDGYVSCFGREGISSTGLDPEDLDDWVRTATELDIKAVEAFLLGDFQDRQALSRLIKGRSHAAVIALSDQKNLIDTLELFAAGADDVVCKPFHVKEILARVKAIQNRKISHKEYEDIGEIRIYSDGRDPDVAGSELALPRRERRIFEYLVGRCGCWVSKAQIFGFVYGLFDECIDESVIESHVSKLRKRLRNRLGYDPIESQRFVGYRLSSSIPECAIGKSHDLASVA